MNNLLNSRKFALSFAVLLLSALMINFCNQIYQCACFFTIMMFSGYFISQEQGKKIANISFALAMAITFAFTFNINYTIHGMSYNGLAQISLISALLAFSASNLLFKADNLIKIFSAILAYSIIDGAIMSSYFAGKFEISRIFNILSQEIFYKIAYSIVAITSVAIWGAISNISEKKAAKIKI